MQRKDENQNVGELRFKPERPSPIRVREIDHSKAPRPIPGHLINNRRTPRDGDDDAS
jgi:hypothetical protein